MTIFVDDAAVRAKGRIWYHMMTDALTDACLHQFAQDLGLLRKWFHGDHYDLTTGQRANAVRAGAVPISAREMVGVRQMKRKRTMQRTRAYTLYEALRIALHELGISWMQLEPYGVNHIEALTGSDEMVATFAHSPYSPIRVGFTAVTEDDQVTCSIQWLSPSTYIVSSKPGQPDLYLYDTRYPPTALEEVLAYATQQDKIRTAAVLDTSMYQRQ